VEEVPPAAGKGKLKVLKYLNWDKVRMILAFGL
jgi:hypothetical protein